MCWWKSTPDSKPLPKSEIKAGFFYPLQKGLKKEEQSGTKGEPCGTP